MNALSVHVLDNVVPASETVAVAVQIEPGNGDFSRDDRMNGSTAVADHQNVLAVREYALHVLGVAQDEWVFVA